MISAYFLQSEIEDPWAHYRNMLIQSPARYDNDKNCWVIYSYPLCKQILEHRNAVIPSVANEGLSEFALRIKMKLARLNNGNSHIISRRATLLLMENKRPLSIDNIMTSLLAGVPDLKQFDWVEWCASTLPVFALLKSFGWTDKSAAFIIERIAILTKIMLPVERPQDALTLNTTAEEIIQHVDTILLGNAWSKAIMDQLSLEHALSLQDSLQWVTANLIGLLIQSYDAVRGLLTNTLLNMLTIPRILKNDLSKTYLENVVIETLRFNGPVHLTRRVANEEFMVEEHTIQKNEMIILTLAAANRDAAVFSQPDQFDINRHNNASHLGFGMAAHRCPGNSYAVTLVTEAFYWVYHKFERIQLIEDKIVYEPLFNLRLPKKLLISLS